MLVGVHKQQAPNGKGVYEFNVVELPLNSQRLALPRDRSMSIVLQDGGRIYTVRHTVHTTPLRTNVLAGIEYLHSRQSCRIPAFSLLFAPKRVNIILSFYFVCRQNKIGSISIAKMTIHLTDFNYMPWKPTVLTLALIYLMLKSRIARPASLRFVRGIGESA